MNFVPIQTILDELTVHPLLRDLTLERVVQHTQMFIRIVGCPKLYKNETAVLKVHDYLAPLPCDFMHMDGVRDMHGRSYVYASDTFFASHVKRAAGGLNREHCNDRFAKEDKEAVHKLFDVKDIEVPDIYIDEDDLDEIDSVFLANHPEIKNKLLYIMLKKRSALSNPPIPPDVVAPRDPFELTEDDLVGIDEDLIADVKRIVRALLIKMEAAKPRKPDAVKPRVAVIRNEEDATSYHMIDYERNRQKDIYEAENPVLCYKIEGNMLQLSTREAPVEIAYRAIPVDHEGFPMIVDDAKFIRALEAYIKCQVFTVLFDMGKIKGDSMQLAKQEYAWAVGAAGTSLKKMTKDEMQSFTNMWNTLMLDTTMHDRQFRDMNAREYIRNH